MVKRTPVDWTLTTRDGARRETLRRWAALPLENIVAALEEMQELGEQLRASNDGERAIRRRVGAARAHGIALHLSGGAKEPNGRGLVMGKSN